MPNLIALKSRHRRAKLQLVSATAATILTATACTKHTSGDDLASLPVFHLSEAPTFTLADDSTPARSFTRITARRMMNGDVAVADEPAKRIAIYDRAGNAVREITHRGSGPGEMDQSFRMSSIGDTLFAFPRPMVLPASIFTASDGFIGSYSPQAHNYAPTMTAVARMTARHWLVQRGAAFIALASAPQPGALTADTVSLGIVKVGDISDSSEVYWLPPIVSAWNIGVTMSNPKPFPVFPSNFPLMGSVFSIVSGNQVWFVNGESGEIRAYDSTASLIVHDTIALPRKPFVEREVTEARDVELANARTPFLSDLINGRYNPKTIPATMPRFSAIHAGDSGEVWLQLFEISPTAAQTFIALSRTGKMIGRLTIPAGLRVQQLGNTFLLALKSDSLGLETVVEYELKR